MQLVSDCLLIFASAAGIAMVLAWLLAVVLILGRRKLLDERLVEDGVLFGHIRRCVRIFLLFAAMMLSAIGAGLVWPMEVPRTWSYVVVSGITALSIAFLFWLCFSTRRAEPVA